ncbi:MAG: addiction module protein [Desulfobacterales bacterium]|nr:addiction module protein [Desulfobacterales bacterium]
MVSKAEFILNEALSLTPSERATIAHCLISSIDEPAMEDVEQEWIELAQKRLSELENNEVKAVSWKDLKQKIRASYNA